LVNLATTIKFTWKEERENKKETKRTAVKMIAKLLPTSREKTPTRKWYKLYQLITYLKHGAQLEFLPKRKLIALELLKSLTLY